MPKFFHFFKQDITNLKIPEKFDYPFYYDPTDLAKLAVKELQDYLENQTDFDHNFGLSKDKSSTAVGKMFGILVVKSRTQEIGYIASVSGKLANTNKHKAFVPPVFDMLNKNGFFLEQEKNLNDINCKISDLENDPTFISLKNQFDKFETKSRNKIVKQKEILKSNKNDRKKRRDFFSHSLDKEKINELQELLIKQSLRDKFEFRKLNEGIEIKKNQFIEKIDYYENEINLLKEERKRKSNLLQNQLFDQYQFLNKYNEKKSLREIFYSTPPSAAGECAAPKLLQYAFLNELEPICMAEFWWGESPKSEVRRHKQFYPACTGKCQPILGHMLRGIELNENPLLRQNENVKDLDILYNDTDIVVINKPEEFLSVPGIQIKDSVYQRIKNKYPNSTGPIIIHRLDMSTSGILILALNKLSHKKIQQQFIKRKVIKRYVALLDGIVDIDKGVIDLPLRVNLDDRPRQMVCYEHGKSAETYYEVIKRNGNKTLVYFYPLTGRTHQLRIHSSHILGLNTPIVGDDLYGTKDKRLYLHADYLEFMHPTTKKIMKFQVKANFGI